MPKKTEKLIPVTRRALVQRMNRALAKYAKVTGHPRGEIRNTRGRGGGTWFLLNTEKNAVALPSVDLQEYAQELGVIKPWEKIVD